MEKLSFLNRLKVASKAAYNAYSGRFTQLDKDGFPVFSLPTATGLTMSADRALYATPVFSCVSLLSQVIASIPLMLYRENSNGGVEQARQHPLYWLLAYKPNRFMKAYDYWLFNMECILLRGGFISWINRSSNGKILSLIPLHPDTVTRELSDTGNLLVSGRAQWGANKYFEFNRTPGEQFFWANYRTLDGLNPCSPIKYAAESIGLALTAEEHGARVFENDATPSGVVELPQKVGLEELGNMAKLWKAAGAGNNYGMPRFVDNGAKFIKIAMSNEDAQYLESRRFQKEDICGIYRVPPSMIGDTQRAQGWSTLGQKNSDFLTYTLSPYFTNIEQAVTFCLLPESEWGDVYADYETKALMRADITTRINYYKGMRDMGSLSANEIRVEEGYNRREDKGGDDYTPAGSVSLKQIPEDTATTQKDNADE
jgi:HK97 family phage portal protein